MKWWKRGSSHILEVCLFNSYVLDQHGKEGDLKRDYLSFRIELAEALIGSFTYVLLEDQGALLLRRRLG